MPPRPTLRHLPSVDSPPSRRVHLGAYDVSELKEVFHVAKRLGKTGFPEDRSWPGCRSSPGIGAPFPAAARRSSRPGPTTPSSSARASAASARPRPSPARDTRSSSSSSTASPAATPRAFTRPGGFTFDVSLHSTTVGLRNGVANLIEGFPEIQDVAFVPHKTLYRAIYPDYDIRVPHMDVPGYIKILKDELPRRRGRRSTASSPT